ncbi:MAG: HopJ type III effector protein [Gammaproteobacteria bacterium]|nr:HopJ type III effector protein [Gammaproteobacteria bacterium]
MNKLDLLIKKIQTEPETVSFQEIISFINAYYRYAPTRFTNGINDELVINEAGDNEGSCKIFAFAQMNELDEIQTLHCFGEYYRVDVLQHPDNDDHANIRTFIKYGWKYIKFDDRALTRDT